MEKLLKRILDEGVHADRAVRDFFRTAYLNENTSKAEYVELIYDLLRFRRLYECALELPLPGSKDTLQRFINASRIRRSLDRDRDGLLERFEKCSENPAVRFSVPDWLYELGKQECGDKWDNILSSLNKEPLLIIRTNYIKTDAEKLFKELAETGLEPELIPEVPGAMIIRNKAEVFSLNSFREGKFEVQDAASQQVAFAGNVKAGMRVVDACAGTGGKTLHLASLMQNKGKIIAFDTHDGRLTELKRRCARANVQNVEARLLENQKAVRRLNNTADRVFVDAPCTGTGVWRRNPDARWHLRKDDVQRLIELQEELLERYSMLVKDGGTLIFSTCSVFRSEGEDQVAKFLRKHENWSLMTEKRLSPEIIFYDGFYIAAMKKQEKK